MSQPAPLLEVTDLALSFSNGSGPRIQAVDGASLTVYPEQTVAVVGESGCGKSVTAMSMMGLVPMPPARTDRGTMMFDSSSGRVDLLKLDRATLRRVRGGEIAMIFQEPMTSLNPVLTIGDQILEAVRLHRGLRGSEAESVAIEALTEVGIRDPERGLRSYPHEYSGGMRQRAMIAMAPERPWSRGRAGRRRLRDVRREGGGVRRDIAPVPQALAPVHAGAARLHSLA